MITFIEYAHLISFAMIIFSGFRMLNYLHFQKKEKSAIYSFNPLVIFDYAALTKKENGKIGIWFKIFVVSIIFTITLGISLVLLG